MNVCSHQDFMKETKILFFKQNVKNVYDLLGQGSLFHGVVSVGSVIEPHVEGVK